MASPLLVSLSWKKLFSTLSKTMTYVPPDHCWYNDQPCNDLRQALNLMFTNRSGQITDAHGDVLYTWSH
jgi:hypothetical protein